MVVHKKEKGHLAEQHACQFLQAQGLKLITKNYRTVLGEIDLIMRHDDDIVFIEVRSRKTNDFGSAIESINIIKQKKILKTALFFLQQRHWLNKVNCRFDVVGVHMNQCEWIQDAFTADIL